MHVIRMNAYLFEGLFKIEFAVHRASCEAVQQFTKQRQSGLVLDRNKIQTAIIQTPSELVEKLLGYKEGRSIVRGNTSSYSTSFQMNFQLPLQFFNLQLT